MDPNLLLSPALLGDLRFQISLLRLMYFRGGANATASVQVVELERLQKPVLDALASKTPF